MTDRILRIEGQAVDPQLTEGLAARAADPLWYLARQWQLGEFHGEDAASPVIVEAEVDAYPLDALWIADPKTGAPVETPFAPGAIPLETLIEREGPETAVPLREILESGLALLRALRAAGLPDSLIEDLRARYGAVLSRRIDDSDPVGLARLALLAEASVDAAKLGDDIAAGGIAALPVLAALSPGDRSTAEAAIADWLAREGSLPQRRAADAPSAWSDRRQGHRFGVQASVPGEAPIRLAAPDYPGGRLDWQDFDFVDGPKRYPAVDPQRLRMLVTPLRFAGQPAARWWEMEEGIVSFGGLAGGPGDLARSVLAAFAAVAGDDWFVLPVRIPGGALARVRAMRVLDDFGGRTEIRAAATVDAKRGVERVWRWCELTGNAEADPDRAPLLLVPPVLAQSRLGDPLEEVHYRRDEAANLAWAIERRYPGVWGRAVERTQLPPPPTPEPAIEDDWTYLLGREVPGHWFPLVPVRLGRRNAEVALRRGTMAATGGRGDASRPRGTLLLPGEPFVIDEAEVPLAGNRVTRRHQLARAADGSAHLWVERRKTPSAGPITRSALEFDRLDGAALAPAGTARR